MWAPRVMDLRRPTLEADGRLAVTGDRDAAARFAAYFDDAPSMGRIFVTSHGTDESAAR